MTAYADMSPTEQQEELNQQRAVYESYKAQELALNMARGKPSTDQLDLSMPLLDILNSHADCTSTNGIDCRNYGVLDGIPEAKRLMATLLDDSPERVIVLGNASLTAMYDTLLRLMMFGTEGYVPWAQLDSISWLCPVPGYDRHFTICEALGIKMIPVPLTDDGPDMDMVEELVASDSSIKGIWCVPQYSNPTGITYSDITVQRLARMTCAAPDFRIFWDNAYAVHHLNTEPSEQDHVFDIAKACTETGNVNRYIKFGSTSKITFPGAGVAALAASEANVAEIKHHMNAQAIGHDKLNQLRHARFLEEGRGIAAHMNKHAQLIKPKFDLVLRALSAELSEAQIATWTQPRGGYFISFDAPEGTAQRIVGLAKDAGVVLTEAGATWPYHHDPYDANIRIAPTLPPLEELEDALAVFTCCVKIAALESLLNNKSAL